MTDLPYVSVHGLDITHLVDFEGVSPSGGGTKVDSSSAHGMDYATITTAGKDAATYSFTILSSSRAELEEARQEINTAPIGAEFCPFTEDQAIYIESAHAAPAQSIIQFNGQWYCSDVEITARNAWLFGDEGGIAFVRNAALPVTATLTNNGYYPAGLDCIIASGSYVSGPNQMTRGLYYSIGPVSIQLCDCLLGSDRFVLDQFGNCSHRWKTEFGKTYAALQGDLGGSTYFNYGTSGYVLKNDCFIGPSGKLWIAFNGPLQVNTPPSIEVDISAVQGYPEVELAYTSDLSDADTIDHDDLVVGKNTIYFDSTTIGEQFVAVGITTDAGSNLHMTSLKASVERFISISSLPVLDPGDSATLVVGDETASNHTLSYLLATYRDIY